ncbi:hypothetical protein GCM10009557_80950 [Virgisporangium ochraceum]
MTDSVGPVVPSSGTLRPVTLTGARLTGGFWGRRQSVNSTETLAHCLAWQEKEGWTGNFTAAPAGRRGREFADSEIYKLAEAMCWDSVRNDHGERLAYLTGLVEVGRRAADQVCAEFAEGANPGICGHPEIETGLVELYRATGEERYLDQARRFVGRRGYRSLPEHEFGWAYFQDDAPVRGAEVFRGHAVRALYLAAGAVDVAVESGDRDLLNAVRDQFDRTIARRTYLTGGMGSRHLDESFGDDFVLPPPARRATATSWNACCTT